MKKKLFALLFSLAIPVIALSNNSFAADTTTNTALIVPVSRNIYFT